MGTWNGGAGGHSVITSNFTMKIEQLKVRLGEKVQLVSGGKKYKVQKCHLDGEELLIISLMGLV